MLSLMSTGIPWRRAEHCALGAQVVDLLRDGERVRV